MDNHTDGMAPREGKCKSGRHTKNRRWRDDETACIGTTWVRLAKDRKTYEEGELYSTLA